MWYHGCRSILVPCRGPGIEARLVVEAGLTFCAAIAAQPAGNRPEPTVRSSAEASALPNCPQYEAVLASGRLRPSAERDGASTATGRRRRASQAWPTRPAPDPTELWT